MICGFVFILWLSFSDASLCCHREASIKALTGLVGQIDRDPAVRFGACLRLIKRGINDKLAQVPIATYDFLPYVGDELAANDGALAHEFARASEGIVMALLEKTSDSNTRLRTGAFESLMYLASHPSIGSGRIGLVCCKCLESL